MSNGDTTPPAVMRMPSLILTSTIVVTVIFMILSAISIYLRLHARRVGRLSLRADDWWILITWILALVLNINIWIFADLIGINYLKDNVQGTIYGTECLVISSCIVVLPLATVKISILLFYKRIFTVRKFKIVAWIAIFIISAWAAVYFFVILFQGVPITAAWTGHGRMQFDTAKVGISFSAINVIFDLAVLCLPIPMILGLRLPGRRKAAVIGIFWLGAFCVSTAIARLVFIHRLDTTVVDSADGSGSGYTLIHTLSTQLIFLILEPQVSIIAGCLPCYGPLFADGRSLGSLVASARSIFSINSIRSIFSRREESSSSLPRSGKQIRLEKDSSVSSESDVELKDSHPWSSAQIKGQNTSSVTHDGTPRTLESGINVSHSVQVSTS